jgi:hypothetical protein
MARFGAKLLSSGAKLGAVTIKSGFVFVSVRGVTGTFGTAFGARFGGVAGLVLIVPGGLIEPLSVWLAELG